MVFNMVLSSFSKVLNKLPSATIEERIVPPGSASRDSGAACPNLETGRLDEATVDWSSLGRVSCQLFISTLNYLISPTYWSTRPWQGHLPTFWHSIILL